MTMHQAQTAAPWTRPASKEPGAPFSLTAEQVAWLSAMPIAERDMHLQILAQSHHYETFPIVGVFDSLSGRPQMRAWERRRDELTAEAVAEYERMVRREVA